MNVFASKRIQALTVISVISMIAAITATVALGLPGGDSSDRVVPNARLAASRDGLAICVQNVKDAKADVNNARSRVEAALFDVAKHPKWSAEGLDTAKPLVEIGCPSEPFLLRSGVSGGKAVGDPTIQKVNVASKYRIFVFILPPDEITRIFGSASSLRRAPQEYLCQGQTCYEVTTAIYLSSEEIDNASFLKEWLEKGIGLEPALGPEPTGPRPPRQ